MTQELDLPEPVTLEWIARQLEDPYAGLGAMIEKLDRVKAETVAMTDKLRAFNERSTWLT